ncbi:MAG: 2-phospho-L-lactate guanylyltransferase [Methanosarcinales archaeon Met12]|nr:MAG: 2-phospho-L-lactate guanylyltransferase [Methanosarcinales archaeon Met12]
MKAIIPFKMENAKSRLSPLLSALERKEFAERMLEDVIHALDNSVVRKYEVLTGGTLDDAINGAIRDVQTPILIVMPDLPLIQPRHINEVVGSSADVVIAPGRGGGTNLLFLREPHLFKVQYHNTSFLRHVQIAQDRGMSVDIYDSFFVSTDMDVPEDLVELLIHGTGAAARYLCEIDVTISTISGRD